MSYLLSQQAVTAYLLSWWKVLLMIPPFIGWAWLVSKHLDKDARYFHLNHKMWNSVHMAGGVAALAAMLFVPIFWIGWPVGMILLAGPILVYWYYRDQRVPEDRKFHLTTEGIGAKIAARRQARAAKQALLQFTDSKGALRPTPFKEDPLFPVQVQAEDIIGPALLARASRVDVIVGPNGGAIEQRIDGIRYKRGVIPADMAVKMIDFLKDIGGLDRNDRRRLQQGEFKVKTPENDSTVTVITAGSSTGQSLRLDFDRATRLNRPFDALGLLPQQIEQLRAFEQIHERHGIILIGAPPGHGLTTTSYSLIGRHDAYTSNVKTLEREIQVTLLGVDQVQWDPHNPDIDYATNLQSMLRRDPDIVLAADVRDPETAQVAADPGIKGPLIYIPQPLPTTTDQIRDWVKKVGDVKDATKALRAVTNQRLLRSLCPNCKQAYQPTPEQIKKLNLNPKKVTQLFRASGKVQVKNKIEDCRVCGGTGYFGQTGAFEVMIVDDEAHKLLGSGDLKGALAHARRNNMFYIQEAALAKVVAGETDIDEVVRVTSPAKSSGSSQPKTDTPQSSASKPSQPTPAR